MAKNEAPKRFSISKGEKGLLMISDASGNARQATSFTRDGGVLRFSLAGDEGALYSVKQGDPEFEELSKAFADAGVTGEPDPVPEKPAARSGSQTPSPQG